MSTPPSNPNAALVLWLQSTVLGLWAMPYGPLAVRVRDGYDPLRDDYRRNHLRPMGCLMLAGLALVALVACGLLGWGGWAVWEAVQGWLNPLNSAL